MPPANELDTQQWLFRQGELVLGPITGRQLVDKLFSGELDGNTPVAPLGEGSYRTIAEVPELAVHLAKAQAKHRVEEADRQVHQAARRRRVIFIASVVTVAVVVALGAAGVARYWAIHGGAESDELAYADIHVEPPTITAARASRHSEELIDYSLGPATNPTPASHSAPGHPSPAHPTPHSAHGPKRPRRPAGAATPSAPPSSPDGLAISQVDRSAIQAVVAGRQRSLYPCFVKEARRHPGMFARIPLEFAIGGDGHVNKLWIDNPDYKQGPLYDCLLRELKKWPFPPNQGESASVQLSFSIGHPH